MIVLFILLMVVTIMVMSVFIDQLEKLGKRLDAIRDEINVIKNVRLRFITGDIKNINEDFSRHTRQINALTDRVKYMEEKQKIIWDNLGGIMDVGTTEEGETKEGETVYNVDVEVEK